MNSVRPTAVVVPVKGAPGGKSRLDPPSGVDRVTLALAMAADTLAAAAATPGVRLIVVTADPAVAALGPPDRIVRDPGRGLAAAVQAGLAAIPAAHPAAVLLGDLPALRPEQLDAALRAVADAAPAAAFVPDAAGSGTVLLGAARRDRLRPGFGPGSAAVHARTATRLDLELPGLRRDVDTRADLCEAVRLGVGRETLAALDKRTGPVPGPIPTRW